MACCAFAAFLLMQLLAPFVWLRDRLFGPRTVSVAGAAAWHPGSVAAPARSGGMLTWRRGLLALAGLELVFLVAGYQYVQYGAQADALDGGNAILTEALHASWCGSKPLAIDTAWSE